MSRFLFLVAFFACASAHAAEKLQFRILAIQLADDDGKNRANIDPQQVAVWVARANHTFLEANVEFVFKPNDGDFITLRNTGLNRMDTVDMGIAPFDLDRVMRVVANYPTRIVVFFRHGRNKDPSGSGFANQRFVVMAGFEDARRCGQQYPSLLAHELGHFFGLPHTLCAVLCSVEQASAWVRSMEAKKADIDGDGLSDTSPIPMIWRQQCFDNQRLVLNGKTFNIPRGNVMSYYQSGETERAYKTMTAQQAAVVRKFALQHKARMKAAAARK